MLLGSPRPLIVLLAVVIFRAPRTAPALPAAIVMVQAPRSRPCPVIKFLVAVVVLVLVSASSPRAVILVVLVLVALWTTPWTVVLFVIAIALPAPGARRALPIVFIVSIVVRAPRRRARRASGYSLLARRILGLVSNLGRFLGGENLLTPRTADFHPQLIVRNPQFLVAGRALNNLGHGRTPGIALPASLGRTETKIVSGTAIVNHFLVPHGEEPQP